MRRLIITLLLFIPPIMGPGGAYGQSPSPATVQANDQWIIQQPKMDTIKDEAGLNKLLGELHKRFPKFEDRLRAIALLRVGTPYEGGCLGEEKEPDNGPLFRWDKSDCTVFVLTNSALAHAKTAVEAKEWMKKLNYYNPPMLGKDIVSYENRLHYTEERLANCSYYKDITKTLLPSVETRLIASLQVTLNKKKDGTHLINIPWEKDVTVYYIPNKKITPDLLKKLPKVCGVAFVRQKSAESGFFVSHEGMIIDGNRLIEADSVDGKVMNYDFMDFNFNVCNTAKKGEEPNLYFDGIIIYEFK